MKYSKSKQGFYPDELLADYQKAGTLPTDLQSISGALYDGLMAAQKQGKIIDWSGSVPVAINPPVVVHVPQSVSPVQAKLALLNAGLLDDVEAIVAQADRATQLAWQGATSFDRSSPTVESLAAALSLSAAQLDALFTTAAAIKV